MAEVSGLASTRASAALTATVSVAVTPRERSSRASSSWSAESIVQYEVGELLNGIDVDAWKAVWRLDVGRHRQNIPVAGKQPGFAGLDAVHLQFGDDLALVAFDEHEVARRQLRHKAVQARRRVAMLDQQRGAMVGGQQHGCGAGLARAPAVLAGAVDVEVVVGVFDHRDLHATRGELRQHPLDQGGLAAAAVAGDAE